MTDYECDGDEGVLAPRSSRCSSFRSRYDEYRKVETYADVLWQVRLFACSCLFPVSMLAMIFAHSFTGAACFVACILWIWREIDRYSQHLDAISGD